MSVVRLGVLAGQTLLGLATVVAGGAKVAGAESQVEDFERFGYPQWFRLATGGVEVVAGVALVASLALTPLLAFVGSFLVAATMVGALLTHARVGDDVGEMLPAAVLLALALGVAWSRAGAVA